MPILGLTTTAKRWQTALIVMACLLAMAPQLAVTPAQAYDPTHQLKRWKQQPVAFSESTRPGVQTMRLNSTRTVTEQPVTTLRTTATNSPVASAGESTNASMYQPSRDMPGSTALPDTGVSADKRMRRNNPTLPWVDLKLAMAFDSEGRAPTQTPNQLSPPVASSISLAQNDTYSLELNGLVRHFHVDNRKICQPVAHNQTRLILVGIKDGTTQLDVLVQSSADKSPTVKRFEIEVRKLPVDKVSSLHRTVEVLDLSIRSGFPMACVQLMLIDGEIFVSGTCRDEKSARQILRVVRRTCSTPVWDQLLVR